MHRLYNGYIRVVYSVYNGDFHSQAGDHPDDGDTECVDGDACVDTDGDLLDTDGYGCEDYVASADALIYYYIRCRNAGQYQRSNGL